MLISTLIQKLQELQTNHGDIEVELEEKGGATRTEFSVAHEIAWHDGDVACIKVLK